MLPRTARLNLRQPPLLEDQGLSTLKPILPQSSQSGTSSATRTQASTPFPLGHRPRWIAVDSGAEANDLSSRLSRGSDAALLSHRRASGISTTLPNTAWTNVFRNGRRHIPGGRNMEDDEDENRGAGRMLRWNRFKKVLFFSNMLLTFYSLVLLVLCLLTWFNAFKRADVIRVANRTELIVSTVACLFGVLGSVVGWAGIILNNRAFLAIYTLLLWMVFAFVVIPGYMTYKRRTFNLEGKINSQWSEDLGTIGRLTIQNQLRCCGYFSPFIEASISQTCYARSRLPGCKLAFLNFERRLLKRWYTIGFGVVPLHMAVMVVSLLCSNHVTYRFGKRMAPWVYPFGVSSVDGFTSQLTDRCLEKDDTRDFNNETTISEVERSFLVASEDIPRD